ncbi:hypothetical protein I6F10_05045 [Pseudoalteromonas sp. SWYJZ98]|uniref:hypothetical protein n=1 Tax=unclassified Pseudoalteromonas TaxID=194690 RepID=UPI00110BAADD|nr:MULTISPECIES: hypothetical protein [unclassified Pseudoalteromonas]MBH0030279.1 hypothetical protein [Pseudoalteromonas sp. SWYJZ98]TMP17019.1 hypothetical protein CWC04_09910 [Pseudoalteromonas sp. S2893]
MNIKGILSKCFLILSAVFLQACGSGEKTFTTEQICTATIAATMGRDPSIIQVDSFKNNTVFLSYSRQGDGKHWKYRCKLDGNRAIWASDSGRWRTDKYDSKIIFSENGDKLSITEKYSDGSGGTKHYSISQLSNYSQPNN